MFSKRTGIATLVTLSLGLPLPAVAASDAEIMELRGQFRQLKEVYEAKIQALELRLKQLESAPRTEVSPVSISAPAVVSAPVTNRVTGEGAFNPAISMVLNGAYGNFSKDPAQYAISGFLPPSNVSPSNRGLSLRESEVAIAANIDPDFRGNLLLSIDEANQVGVEEAYFQSIGLGSGLSLKGGRFFSAIGYQNEVHSHAWDFVDAPLVYRAFLSGDNYADDGLQLRWLAPSENLIELGAEIGRGKDRPGSNRNKNGSAAGTLFAHFGGDVGESHSYRLGVSALRTSPSNAPANDIDSQGADVINTFSGATRLAAADFVYKYAPNGNAQQTSLKLQGEYFRRSQSGTMTFDTVGSLERAARNIASRYTTNQSGWYLQGVYQFMPQWRAGLRFDRLDHGNIGIGAANAGNVAAVDYNPSRTSVMLDYSPSEFTRFRLQFAQDKSRQNVTDNQLILQYIFSLGAHGAHKF
ncbi:MAG: hypothetical protein ABI583_02325 [Betaproteobacteria bacterium]